MGGWTIRGAMTLIYFCVRRQSSGTHRYSVGENPDSIHRSLSSLPSLDLFWVSVSLFLATALAVNGDTNVIHKSLMKENCDHEIFTYFDPSISLLIFIIPSSSNTNAKPPPS